VVWKLKDWKIERFENWEVDVEKLEGGKVVKF
jgi:hypothetical protein